VTAPHDFAKRRVLQVGQARAVFIVRQKQIPQSLLARLRLQFFHDPRGFPAFPLNFFVESLFVWIHVDVHEAL